MSFLKVKQILAETMEEQRPKNSFWEKLGNRREQFKALESNKGRIEFILNNIKPLEKFRKDYLEKAKECCTQHTKSLQKSQFFRDKGLQCLEQNDYESAVSCFTIVSIYSFV